MVNFVGKVCLAPMVRLGELPTRLMSLAHGCDLVWSPEIIDKKIVQTTRIVNSQLNTIDYVIDQPIKLKKHGDSVKRLVVFRTSHAHERGNLIFQLGLADPTVAVDAALKVIDDVDGIDLNCGCPKPFSTHAGMGAALLSTPDLLCLILKALVEKVGKPKNKPILCKIRMLDTLESTTSLVEQICATGITNLTIHCRTRDMRNRQDPRWMYLPTLIPLVKSKGISVVINGNLQSRSDILNMRKVLNDEEIGGMIAEAAECNPLVFSATPQIAKKTVLEFLDLCTKFQPENLANIKFMILNLVPGKLKYYMKFAHLRTLEDFHKVADEMKDDDSDLVNKFLVKDCQKQLVLTQEEYTDFITKERPDEMKYALSRKPGDPDRGDIIKKQEQEAAVARKRAREAEEEQANKKPKAVTCN